MLTKAFSSLSRDEALTLIMLISGLEQMLKDIDVAEVIKLADSIDQPEQAAQEDEYIVD
ncbi:MAG TPA: hypothetical protein VE439_04060 [Anaerolineae bacterium]|nr:hypothetical protein [Anaerolineae bacterium]